MGGPTHRGGAIAQGGVQIQKGLLPPQPAGKNGTDEHDATRDDEVNGEQPAEVASARRGVHPQRDEARGDGGGRLPQHYRLQGCRRGGAQLGAR